MKIKLSILFLLIFIVHTCFAQTIITGKVIDAKDGSAISGATIKAKGSKATAITSSDGSFSITANAKQLVISNVGYKDETVTVTEAVMNIRLTQSEESLTDVVVTGYANRTQRSNSGSAAVVNMSEIRNPPVASFDNLLQGSTPGLDVKNGSGQPGSSADILIRGRGSINGSVVPLFIIDGVQVQSQDFATMNAADFASITVLKDAASTAIYGSRGANGVIVITTKKGVAGTTRYSYNGQYGESEFPKSKLVLMNSAQKLNFEQNIAPNLWGWTNEQFDSLRKISTDWYSYVFKRAATQSHEISASGGNDKTTFYASTNYLDQGGNVINTYLRRYTGRLNLTHNDGNFRMGINMGGGWSKQQTTSQGNTGVGSALNTVLWALPYETPYTATGAYTNSIQFPYWLNPVEDLKNNPNTNWELKLTGSAFLEYRFPFLKNLSYRLNTGGDYSQVEVFNLIQNGSQSANQSAAFGSSYAANGQVTRSLNRRFIYTVTNSLTYKTMLDKAGNHSLTTSLYQEFQRDASRNFNYTGYGLLLPYLNEGGLVQGTAQNGYIANVGGGFPTNSALSSYFATADYSFKSRYYLTLSARTDASSKLSPANRSTQYGSVGGSWIVSDEAFFHAKFVNLLKLRASYGSNGNQNPLSTGGSLLQFPYLQQYGRGLYGGKGTLQVNSLGNQNLTWEKRATANIGVDAAFWNNRITTTVEVYRSLTTGLYFNPFVPSTSGGNGTILSNSGSMENKGIEALLNVKIVDGKAFKWSVGGNFSYNKNTIKSLPNGQDLVTAPSGIQVLKVGKPVNSFYLVRYAGVDPQTGSSLYYTADGKTTTSTYSTNDRVILGTSDAPYNGGILTNISFKGIELGVNFTYSFGNYIYNNARFNVENSGYVNSGFAADALNAWTKPGQITDFPILTETTQSNTTRFLENDNFWRLRNVMLSYNLPKTICAKLKLQGVRIYAQGQNLYTHFKFQGWDPEVSSIQDPAGGTGNYTVSGAQYPQLKTVTLGLNLTL